MLRLFHGQELIGVIRNEAPDGLAMAGDIELTPDAAKYKEIFEFFADDEKASTVDPPFGDEWIENWSIEMDDGKRLEISIPTIYSDGLILWR